MKSFQDIREYKKTVEESLEENKIFFVKVGDGRDSMTVKVKADTKSAAVKKMKTEYPKEPVSLDRNQKQGQPAGALESIEEGGLYAPSVQTKYGIVTVSKRDTKGMRGKQDGFKLTLKTKSGKTVDLGSHPRPTDANIKSIAKNVMEAVSPAQQAAIAISKKEKGEKPLDEKKIGNMGPYSMAEVKAALKAAGVKGAQAINVTGELRKKK